MIMLQNHQTCKLQNSLFSYRNSNKESNTGNGSGTLHQYQELKSPIGANYKQIPSSDRGFAYRKSDGGDGRSPQSKQGERVDLPPAETNVCSNNVSFMKTANGAATPDPNSSISCKYSDCNSTNLQTRERPDTPHYAELICCECGRHQKWLGNLEKQQQQRERIERLWFLRNRLNDWDKGFLDNVRLSKKLSPKQQAQLDRIEREVGGLK